MLCQFSFQNFKSYKFETTFDVQATAIPEFESSLIVRENSSNLLPVSVIYGPNGGGKSNLLQALACLISTVVKPIYQLEKTKNRNVFQQQVFAEPFLFDEESKKEPTEFKVFFRSNTYEYRYYLGLLNHEIVAETLDRKAIGGKKPAHIFYREGKEITLGATLRNENVNINVNSKMPYLSFLAINYDIPLIVEVQKWFEECIIRNYANPNIDSVIEITENVDYKKLIISMLNDMDVDIADYRVDEKEKELYIKRRVGDFDFELTFEHESDGTKKLIAVLPLIILALKEGRLMIIDELDAKLHPKLLRYVISLFKNRNINKFGAQLIFTSHDISTMKNTVFRRDEIWFAALDDNRSSEIYTLYEIRRENKERINSTAAFDKQYMEGRYGADPYLRNILDGGEWNESETSQKK